MGNLNYMQTFQYHRLVIQKNGVKLNGTTLHCSQTNNFFGFFLFSM